MTAKKPTLKELRTAVADYIRSEGCGCCSNHELHKEHADRLGKLLSAKKYSDNSGYDFGRYETKEKQ